MKRIPERLRKHLSTLRPDRFALPEVGDGCSVWKRITFRNEVVWKRTSTKSLGKRYAVNTDRILYYVKSDGATWNQQYTPYDNEYIRKTFRHQDKHGRWGTVDLSGGKAGSERAYMPFKGIEPPPGRAWAPPTRNKFPASAQVLLPDNYEALDQLAKCEALDDAGLLHWSKGGKGRPRWKKYLSAMPGVVAGDLVLDTPPVKGKERHRLSHTEADCPCLSVSSKPVATEATCRV